MARTRAVAPCMFCGELPCVCKKKKTATKSKVNKPQPLIKVNDPEPELVRSSKPENENRVTSNTLPTFSAREAMKARAAKKTHQRQKLTPPPVPEVVSRDAELSTEEIEFNSAVKALAPILHPAERRKYIRIIESETNYRAAAWKLKVKEGTNGL